MSTYKPQGRVIKQLYLVFKQIGKQSVTGRELIEKDKIIATHLSTKAIGSLLSRLGWQKCGVYKYTGIAGQNRHILWAPPDDKKIIYI